MRNPFSKPSTSHARLRDVLQYTRTTDSLNELPDRLAAILEAYNRSDCHPEYRKDVFKILDSAACLSEALLNDEYPVDRALSNITLLMETLPRLISFLSARPVSDGFSILNPETKTLLPHVYKTGDEAHSALRALQQMGIASTCTVVPVKVTSQHALQPKAGNTSQHTPPPDPIHSPLRLQIDPSRPPPVPPSVSISQLPPIPLQATNETRSEDFEPGNLASLAGPTASYDEGSSDGGAKTQPRNAPETASGGNSWQP